MSGGFRLRPDSEVAAAPSTLNPRQPSSMAHASLSDAKTPVGGPKERGAAQSVMREVLRGLDEIDTWSIYRRDGGMDGVDQVNGFSGKMRE